jgi:hypothetical protein
VRGFLLGLVLLVGAVATLLSIRPRQLRRQLWNAGRRLRIALALAGVYLLGSGLARLLVSDPTWREWTPLGLAAVLAIAFVALGQDREPPPQAESRHAERQPGQR